LYFAKEKLKIVSVRGRATHFCLATPEPRKARRGNTVRAIFKIHRQLEKEIAELGVSVEELLKYLWKILRISQRQKPKWQRKIFS
jgi:hypothetical protein